MIAVGVEEQDWLDGFLRAHVAQAMFPLDNLRNHGFGDHAPRAMQVWRTAARDGVICLTTQGMLMPVMPGAADIGDAVQVVRGRRLVGALGETEQVEAAMRGLDLSAAPRKVGDPEPHLLLSLADLRMPGGAGDLIPLGAADPELMIEWRAAYGVEVLGSNPATTRESAARDIARYIERDSHRVLVVEGRPVAMTGFNAILPEIVQIGGVYTPPPLRGKGYAGVALALHLAEAQLKGVSQAVLSAANDAAAKVYTRIGFRKIGMFSMFMFKTAQDV